MSEQGISALGPERRAERRGDRVSDATYQVRIAGAVPPELLQELSDLTVTVEPPETILYGWLPDQSALFGLIVRLHGFGLDVIEVRRLAGGEDHDETPLEQ